MEGSTAEPAQVFARAGAPVDAARYRLALEAGRMGTWYWDIASSHLDWDDQVCGVFGVEPGSFDGTFEAYLALVHADDVAATVAVIEQSLAARSDHYVEHRVLLPDGSLRWVAGIGQVLLDDDGEVSGMVGVAADISDRKAAEEARLAAEAASAIARDAAQRTQSRLALLGRISGVLGASLDVATTFQQLADLAVQEGLADWCVVDVPGAQGLDRMALSHSDPSLAEVARRLRDDYPQVVDPRQGVGKVLATGEPELMSSIAPELLDASAVDAEHLALLRGLDLSAAMLLPLRARGRVLGVLSLVGSAGRAFEDEDLETALEVARRASVALDNAYLYAERDRVARTLQASLLPPALPTVPGIEVAAVYRPGSEALGIGGDFYDVFPTGTDRWMVVIGDVCGKGVDAAVLTGVVRYAVRAAAVLVPSPAIVLEAVNEALLREDWDDRFATLSIAELRLGAEGPVLTLAGGGHPPALLRRADGEVDVLDVAGSLVGVLERPAFGERTVPLAPGDCLLLYTDGVTEAGSTSDLFGDHRLADALRGADGSSAESVARAVLAAVEEFRSATVTDVGGADTDRDDVAIVALRVR